MRPEAGGRDPALASPSRRGARGTFDEVAVLMETYATLGVSRFYLQASADFARDDGAAYAVELAAAAR